MPKTLITALLALLILVLCACGSTRPAEGGGTDRAGGQPADNESGRLSGTVSVTIKIECHTAMERYEEWTPAVKKVLDAYAPDGVMLEESRFDIEAGSSVQDLLKQATDQYAEPLVNLRDGSSGSYIVGIGGLSEFDCGSSSGWMYSVNGEYPMVSADACELSDTGHTDAVVFSYTCRQGDLDGTQRLL